MMTIGRLKAIESYWSRIKPEYFGVATVGVASKHTTELIAEVKRLRESLEILKIRCGDCIGMAAKNDDPALSVLMYVTDFVSEALREPDIGAPDFSHIDPITGHTHHTITDRENQPATVQGAKR